ncbi:hypothetical protein R3P38DRAFT_3482657 [Favolaschia claudopus]|uniref:DUF6534 domain-containing protein n=1 Tax=Favolaschia claudopus TaxID=2862362 RepID=A0AAV9Z7E7_9AGAR
MSSGIAASFDVNGTIGAYEIGVLISYVLLGITITQTYLYFTRFPDDHVVLKCLVHHSICEIAHAICIAHSLYQFTVIDYGQPDRLLNRLPLSLDTAIFFSALIEQAVLGFFSFRIYTLSENLSIPLLIVSVTTIRLIAAMVTFGVTLNLPSLASYTAHWGWLSIMQWSLGVANDFLTTGSLVYLLHTQRAGMRKRTVAVMDKVILWSVETGLLTSASSIFMLVFYLTMSHRLIWLAVFVIVSRMYSNTLLANLNSRGILRSMNDPRDVSLSNIPETIETLQTGDDKLSSSAPRHPFAIHDR